MWTPALRLGTSAKVRGQSQLTISASMFFIGRRRSRRSRQRRLRTRTSHACSPW